MGSIKIWIAASIAYAVISAAIYIIMCWRRGYHHLILRGIAAVGCYLALALGIIYVVHKLSA